MLIENRIGGRVGVDCHLIVLLACEIGYAFGTRSCRGVRVSSSTRGQGNTYVVVGPGPGVTGIGPDAEAEDPGGQLEGSVGTGNTDYVVDAVSHWSVVEDGAGSGVVAVKSGEASDCT